MFDVHPKDPSPVCTEELLFLFLQISAGSFDDMSFITFLTVLFEDV